MAHRSGSTGGSRVRRGLTIVVLAAALALPAIAFGAPTNIQVKDNFFQPQAPAARAFQTGASFHWQRGAGSTLPHNVRQDAGLFRSGNLTSGPINYSISASAGTYHYYCELHGSPAGGMAGVVKVRPISNAAPVGNPFTVTWANSTTNTGKAFDVRYKVGSGTFKIWKNDTSQFKAIFGLNMKPVPVMLGKTYQFQVRSEQASNHSKFSGWSPTLTVTP
jgi:plastocyanin